MNIGNITSNNFNLDSNGKDMQIDVYEQLIEQLQEENKKLKIQISAREEEYKKLEDNWNKLREFILEEGFEINTREYGSLDVIDKNVILEEIQELEQGSDSK